MIMSLGIEQSIPGAPQNVVKAIQKASATTGVNFDYLVNQARAESSFRTDVKAATSSATGLYQFIDQTWLSTVSKHGSKHGLSDQANAIQRDFQGRYFVSDDTQKSAIMDMRKDPDIASLMAAEFALDNQKIVESKTGVEAGATELYFAHFLGAHGASQFINAMQEAPYRPAAFLFPSAASANKNIFYHSDGSPKKFNEIYNHFSKKFEDVTPVQTASHDTDRSYTRDIQFERMYGQNIQKFVRDMPGIQGFESGQVFHDLFANDVRSLMQSPINSQSLFLTLTMLDDPK